MKYWLIFLLVFLYLTRLKARQILSRRLKNISLYFKRRHLIIYKYSSLIKFSLMSLALMKTTVDWTITNWFTCCENDRSIIIYPHPIRNNKPSPNLFLYSRLEWPSHRRGAWGNRRRLLSTLDYHSVSRIITQYPRDYPKPIVERAGVKIRNISESLMLLNSHT